MPITRMRPRLIRVGRRSPECDDDNRPSAPMSAAGADAGAGTAPGTFALEFAFDEAAERLGIDPVELRGRNFADHDQDAGLPWSSNGLFNVIASVPDVSAGGGGRPRASPSMDAGGSVGAWRAPFIQRSVKPVMSASGWRRMPLCVFNAEPRIWARDICACPDRGSGLGVSMSQVTVELGDTWLPEGPFSGGSQVTASIAPRFRWRPK